MTPRTYRTSDMAQAGGVHVNTVRLFESLGYLPPVPRHPRNNYRQFSALHLDHMRLIRLALRVSWLGERIGQVAVETITRAASGNLVVALDSSRNLAALVQAEQDQAEAAAAALEHWAHDPPQNSRAIPLTISQTAGLLNVTTDMLRSWERNGLIDVPRNPANGYRQYGPPEIARLRIIRALRTARYSTMSILRMLLHLDSGHTAGLREKLDTPDPDDDVYTVTDHWLSTVAELKQTALGLVAHVQMMLGTYDQNPP